MGKLHTWLTWLIKKYTPFIMDLDNPLQDATKRSSRSGTSDSVKECTRDKATRARVAKAFNAQKEQIEARLATHSFYCEDTLTCTGCYRRVPDKKISKPYIPKRRMRRSVVRENKTKCV